MAASLFVGGGSIEGYVRVTVEETDHSKNKRQLVIARISADILGMEEKSGGRRSVFLNLARVTMTGELQDVHIWPLISSVVGSRWKNARYVNSRGFDPSATALTRGRERSLSGIV